MKQLLIPVILLFFTLCAKSEKLKDSAWNIMKVDCKVVAQDTVKQAFLDSLFLSMQQKAIVPADQYMYKFTSDELLKKTKSKEFHWKYKETGDNLVIDAGKGIVFIQQFEIRKDTLILEMNKSLFLLSEFGAKIDSIKSMIKDISLKYYYKKK